MYLLSITSNEGLSLTQHSPGSIPPYAILSHTWGDVDQEVTFQDVTEGAGKDKLGYRKIEFCGERAAQDGIEYFWVDTCCINKLSSAELSESITSMFQWYKRAARCYVYLSDISKEDSRPDGHLPRASWKPDFRRSRWFTRGWTLQELIAPSSVEFFSAEGQRLGNRGSLEQLLHEITGIAIGALRGRDLSEFTVDERRSWAHGRETKREEDRAYSLLGIFKVSLVPNYGEGADNAFNRLDEEIFKRANIGGKWLTSCGLPLVGTSQSLCDIKPLREATDYYKHLWAARSCEGNELASINGVRIAISPKDETRRQLLDLLYFEEIDAQFWTLKPPHAKTCEWFHHTEQYNAWTTVVSSHHRKPFLLIRGKPGVGKSTLVKFLYSEAKEKAKSSGEELVLSFFFNAQGGQLEKSTLGLYRSLLWQLFESSKNLRKILDALDVSARRIVQRDGWQLEILKLILANAVNCLGSKRLKIFIDALDECRKTERAEMISFFEDLGESAIEADVHFQICLSSRHYPPIDIHRCAQIVLEDEEEHSTDIVRFIEAKLSQSVLEKNGNISSEILAKSEGIFLWVALVVPILNTTFANGEIGELRRYLNGIPNNLDRLFEMILERDNEDLEDFKLCIQWTLFAKRPLKLREYYFAIRGSNSLDIIRSWDSGDVSSEDMRRFVHSSSKGLIEVTKTCNKRQIPTVQFIHESVRTFFLNSDKYQRLWPDLDVQFIAYGHDVLKNRCISEIKASISSRVVSTLQPTAQPWRTSSEIAIEVSEYLPPHESLPEATSEEAVLLRQSISAERPLLEYAVNHVLYHADSAACNTIDQADFLDKFPLGLWILLDNLFEKYKIRRHTPDASLLYIIAEKNLPRLIKHELKRVPNMDIRGERHYFPMFAACFNNNYEAIEALLMQETELQPNPERSSQLSSWCAIKPQRREPISCAAEEGHEDIVRLLLATGKIDPDSKTTDGWTPLSFAARFGQQSIARMLLDTRKVDPDSKTSKGWTPLSFAARYGHTNIFEMLLKQRKVDINRRTSDGWTPLSFAARFGYEDIVEMLLKKRKISVDSKTSDGWTPLAFAAWKGYESIVRMLLDTGKVDPDSRDNDNQTPLSFAASGGHESVVEMLLKTDKVNPDSKTSDGWTPLSFAAMNGHESIVRLLLATNKVNRNSKDSNGWTPLSFATENGHESIARILRR